MPFRYQELLPFGVLEDDKSLATIFGSKPTTPDYPTSSGVLDELFATNRKALPEAKAQAAEIQAFNQDTLNKALRDVLGPDYLTTNKAIGETFRKRLVEGDLGDLPDATINRSAARALGGGYGGGTSGMERNLTARDLGLLQYEETNRNIGAFNQWMTASKAALTAPQFDIGNFLFNIPQQIGLSEGKFARDVLASNIAAAPNPGERGRFETNLAIASAAAQFFGGGAINTPKTGSPGSAGGSWNGGSGGGGGGFNYFSTQYPGQPSPNYDPPFDQEAADWGGSGYGKGVASGFL
jgi:hypothetical protein